MDRVKGVGLGLRVPLADDLLGSAPTELAWLEVAPENFMRRGGRYPAVLARALARWPVVPHGLALSLGGTAPLDRGYLAALRRFLRDIGAPWHSDHLSFGVIGQTMLHELLPLPFTREAAAHVAARVRHAQDVLGVPFAVENVTAYARPAGAEMDEADFIGEIVRDAGCLLLLDVNNVYVNSKNFGFDPRALIQRLPLDRVVQIHVAGHDATDPELLVDTHAEPVCDGVFSLLEWTLERTGRVPVLLERDDKFPAWDDLCGEVRTLHAILERATARHAAAFGPTSAPRSERRTSALTDYEQRVRALCLGDEPAPDVVAPLGDGSWRWCRYRDMVRRRLLDVVEQALPRFEAAIGKDGLIRLFDRFLEGGGSASPFIRDVPGELLAWLDSSGTASELPASALDLARYEWARQSTGHEADGPAPNGTELDMSRPAALLYAHRLLALSHPAHRDEGSASQEKTFLCLYRDPSTHDVKTLELTAAAHALLEELGADRPLSSAISRAAERVGAPLDRAFLEATSAVIADFVDRGLLVGGIRLTRHVLA